MDAVAAGVGGGGEGTSFVSFAERFRRGFVLEGATRVAGAVVYDEPPGGGRTEHLLRNGVEAARLRPVRREAKGCVEVERRTGVPCLHADPRAAAAAFPGAAAVWLDGVDDPEGVAERAMQAMAKGGCLVLGCCVRGVSEDLADGRARVRQAMEAAGAEEVVVDRIRSGGGTVVVVGCGVAAEGTGAADDEGPPLQVGQRVRSMGKAAVVLSVDVETELVEVREVDRDSLFVTMQDDGNSEAQPVEGTPVDAKGGHATDDDAARSDGGADEPAVDEGGVVSGGVEDEPFESTAALPVAGAVPAGTTLGNRQQGVVAPLVPTPGTVQTRPRAVTLACGSVEAGQDDEGSRVAQVEGGGASPAKKQMRDGALAKAGSDAPAHHPLSHSGGAAEEGRRPGDEVEFPGGMLGYAVKFPGGLTLFDLLDEICGL